MGRQKSRAFESYVIGWIIFVCMFLLLSVSVHAAPNSTLSANVNAAETACTINWSGYTMPSDGAVISAAVWSAKGGQDDIRWRDLKSSNGTYTVSFNISDHATSGEYYVHLYLRTKTGQMIFLQNTAFTISPAKAATVSVENMDVKARRCQVVVTGVTSPSGVQSVLVPVWSKSNQSDIIWYSASKRSDGAWTVTVDFSKHGDSAGTYHIHVYATSANRCQDYVGNTKTEYKTTTQETPVAAASLKGEKCDVNVSGLKSYGAFSRVMFAIWSKTDGQDDLHWETASYNNADGTATKTVSLAEYCDYGNYFVHVYGVDSANKYTFLCSTEFDLPYPKIGTMDISADAKAFKIQMKDFSCVGGIDRIKVAVWSKSDQNDIVWYTASKQTDGSYLVSSDISKHKNNMGTYHAHAYLYDGRDSYGHCAATADFTIAENTTPAPVTTAGEMKVSPDAGKTVYTAQIQDISVTASYTKLLAAVWSRNNGQDDLHWYTASESGSAATVKIEMRNHPDAGEYYLHLYAQKSDGGMLLVKPYTFSIAENGANVSSMAFENQARSTVDVCLRLGSDIRATGAIIPVWSKSDQSDIKWYEASKQNDGTYRITINVVNHNNNEGTYNVHAYYRDSTGNLKFVCGSSVQLYAPEAGEVLSEEGCVISDGNTVALTVSVNGAGTYGLFAIEGEERFNPAATPLATVSGSGKITLRAPLGFNTANSLLNKKLVVGIQNGTGYSQVTQGMYITNPEAVASNTREFPTVSSKKGLQVNTSYPGDAGDLGVKHSVINIVLSNIPCQSGGISYNYNGKTWHMDMGYVYSLDQVFAEQAANGSIVSAILLMPWDSEWANLIIPSGRTPGYSFYGLNAEERAAREQLAAIFSFLANRYSDSGHNVVNWILGNEVSDFTHYNWCGNVGLQEYAAYYAHAFRLLYNSVKSQYSNARVYISLDHVWNYPRSYGFKGMDMFNAFVNALQAEGDINWNIAFHPYPNPLTSPAFWKNKTGVTNSSSSNIITMMNLQYLTEYIKNTYGAQHRFILSETGFTSYTGGVHDEKLQAAAIAYGYYLAEFNDMVDSFVVHRHIDHPAEMSQGLYFGLWSTNSASYDVASSKKFAWTVYKYMDTSQGAAYTNFALPIIGANSWSSIVPGYSAARFS